MQLIPLKFPRMAEIRQQIQNQQLHQTLQTIKATQEKTNRMLENRIKIQTPQNRQHQPIYTKTTVARTP
ncbi:hypothetical protein UMN179_01345 [Gallibacterium anatis UMN179]|uniref:Uncharacterized protein n=1 Tax=Gallibacterium anatis (strain UMN179) TaxID=1005058 RepID=F4HAJ0_GALAU|nr:hypothetical protein UMN179_01345 [Gallibacterium anatis UMN179]